jgi:polyisoprenoid-binding protein YceI
MKTVKTLALLLLAATFTLTAQKTDINTSKSTVKWTGNKVGGSHNGDIKVKSGAFEFKGGNIASGVVVIDMNTITCADLTNEGANQKLVGHLKSDDFFGVEKFPTASFKVTKATKFNNGKATLTGLLTIKGKAESISFDVTKKGNVYSAQVKVDRSKYDVRYGSKSFFDNLGDNFIDDIFILDIQLVM